MQEGPVKVNVWKELTAGAIAGSASVIVGHPFDTVKVQLQTSLAHRTDHSCVGVNFYLKRNSIISLFRGISAPLASVAAVNSITFYSFGLSKQVCEDVIGTRNNNTYAKLPIIIGGCASGLVKCLLLCPIEMIKCRLQIMGQHRLSAVHASCNFDVSSTGPFGIMKNILKSHGIRGLYHGYWASICREVPSCGFYFYSYDYVREKLNGYKSIQNKSNLLTSSIAGGISGCISWAIVYPLDVIKTRIQTNDLESKSFGRKSNVWHVGKNLVAEFGWKCLYRGFNVTVIRAFPVNAIIFPTYEFVLRCL